MMLVEIYTKSWCSYCRMAKVLLDRLRITYREIEITGDAEKEKEMIERAGRRSVPQIFINNRAIGGFQELSRLAASGEINTLVNDTPEEKS